MPAVPANQSPKAIWQQPFQCGPHACCARRCQGSGLQHELILAHLVLVALGAETPNDVPVNAHDRDALYAAPLMVGRHNLNWDSSSMIWSTNHRRASLVDNM